MTMSAARTQNAPLEDAERTTWCQLRRMGGRWELFIECQRTGSSRGRRLSSFMRSLDQLRGIEAVTVLVGPPRNERAPARYGICIPEHGDARIFLGPSDDRPEIHLRSYEDRWLARFVLPRHWIPTDGEPLLLSLIRTHEDNLDFETAQRERPVVDAHRSGPSGHLGLERRGLPAADPPSLIRTRSWPGRRAGSRFRSRSWPRRRRCDRPPRARRRC